MNKGHGSQGGKNPKPITYPNGSSAVSWLSFWFGTRFSRKKLDHSRGTFLHLVFMIPMEN